MSTQPALDEAEATLRCPKCGGTDLRLGYWGRTICNACHPPTGKRLSDRSQARQRPLLPAERAQDGTSDAE